MPTSSVISLRAANACRRRFCLAFAWATWDTRSSLLLDAWRLGAAAALDLDFVFAFALALAFTFAAAGMRGGGQGGLTTNGEGGAHTVRQEKRVVMVCGPKSSYAC